MQRISYPTETALTKKINRNRTILSFKDSISGVGLGPSGGRGWDATNYEALRGIIIAALALWF